MPVLDSELFVSGGGSSMKPYVSGMSVKFGETVRSMKNMLPYGRYSTSPVSKIITSDPANLQDDFLLEDPSTQIGSIKSFQDSHSITNGVYRTNGQVWLRTGTYLELSSAGFTREVPQNLKAYYDLWLGVGTTGGVGMSGTIVDMVGDGNGNWMAINSTGTIFRSATDAATWEAVAQTTTASAKITTNGTGRWWYCNNAGLVFGSDNFGTSWTQLASIGSTPTLFKFLNGKVYFSSTSGYPISGASGNLVFAAWLPDTISPASVWTNLNYPAANALPHFTAGTTAVIRDACTNGVDRIWFVGPASNNYIAIFTLNTTTGTMSVNSMGSSNTIQGMAFDPDTGYAWFVCSFYNGTGSNSSLYENFVTTTGAIGTYTDGYIAGRTYSTQAGYSVGTGGGYSRRGGHGVVLTQSASIGSTVLYKNSGISMALGRSPAVNGGLSGFSFNGMVTAGHTTVLFGSSISRSKPAVGIPTGRSVSAGYADYVRVQ